MKSSKLQLGEERLWRLIAERSVHGSDVDAIDRRIWDLFGERWAVMFTDLSGFSRQVEAFGILHFLQVIHEKRELLLPIVDSHDGVLVKLEADSFLLLFRRPAQALACAVAMRRATQHANERRTPEERILLCVGMGYGDVLRIGENDVWGREVNAASKLGEDIAQSNEILLTDAFREGLEGADPAAFAEIAGVAGSPRNWRYVG